MAKRRLKPYLLTFCIASRFLIAVITRAYARFKIFSRFIQSRSDEISCVKTCAGDGWIRNKLLRANWNFKILLIITLFFYIEKFSKRIIIYPIVNNYRSIQILLENCIRTAQSIISKWILNNYSRFSLLGKSTVVLFIQNDILFQTDEWKMKRRNKQLGNKRSISTFVDTKNRLVTFILREMGYRSDEY